MTASSSRRRITAPRTILVTTEVNLKAVPERPILSAMDEFFDESRAKVILGCENQPMESSFLEVPNMSPPNMGTESDLGWIVLELDKGAGNCFQIHVTVHPLWCFL